VGKRNLTEALLYEDLTVKGSLDSGEHVREILEEGRTNSPEKRVSRPTMEGRGGNSQI